jgi:hypothetical protein
VQYLNSFENAVDESNAFLDKAKRACQSGSKTSNQRAAKSLINTLASWMAVPDAKCARTSDRYSFRKGRIIAKSGVATYKLYKLDKMKCK